MKVLTVLFLALLGCILTNSRLSLTYAAMGLGLWYEKMIPSLLPFMILSGIMVRMRLTGKVAMLIYPIVKPLYKVRKNVCYAMLMGFLCGFPMGARVVDDLYQRGMIDKREAEYLLAFCNNIGPVFFTGFVLAFLPSSIPIGYYLLGMYGIPLCYGLLLRYLYYGKRIACENTARISGKPPAFATALDASVLSGIRSITKLGGYMIFFNLLNILPKLFFHRMPAFLHALEIPVYLLLEITGGIKLAGMGHPLLILTMLQLGGCSCIAQTYAMVGDTDLSMTAYVLHKLCQSALSLGYYSLMFHML